MKQTKSAPMHNMFAGRKLGTADSAIRRSSKRYHHIILIVMFVLFIAILVGFVNDMTSQYSNILIAYVVKD